MRLLLAGALFGALTILSVPALGQDCTAAGARAPAGTLASPAPPCKRPAEAKEKPAKLDKPTSGNGFSGFYVGGSISKEFAIQRR